MTKSWTLSVTTVKSYCCCIAAAQLLLMLLFVCLLNVRILQVVFLLSGGFIMFTVSTQVLDEWQDRLDASIKSFTQQGLWQLVEKRWCQYGYYGTQKLQAMVPVLKIT